MTRRGLEIPRSVPLIWRTTEAQTSPTTPRRTTEGGHSCPPNPNPNVDWKVHAPFLPPQRQRRALYQPGNDRRPDLLEHAPADKGGWTFLSTNPESKRGLESQRSVPPASAPTARSIPAWANGPGHRCIHSASPVGARHAGPMERAFSPSEMTQSGNLGRWPRLVWFRAVGPHVTKGQTISRVGTTQRGLENPRSVPPTSIDNPGRWPSNAKNAQISSHQVHKSLHFM